MRVETKKMSKPEEVDKMRRLLKQLREVTELNEWLSHTNRMIEKVEGLSEDRDTLEIIILEVILIDECKRWFERGNRKKEGGLVYLAKYLEMDHVKGQISKEERSYTQINPNNNNKICLIDYVTRKRKLLLAKEKKFRENEDDNFQEIWSLIKQDMSAEDEKLIGIMTKFKNYDELIEICEVLSQFEKKEKIETKVVATIEKKEAGIEKKEEVFEASVLIAKREAIGPGNVQRKEKRKERRLEK